MKLLLVEDNLDNARLTTSILQTAGYEVIHKACGLEGLRTAKQAVFDAIILDFDLPDIDGAQVGLALRKLMRHTVIVALTAHTDRVSQTKARSFGFDAFIGKPYNDEDLLNILAKLIERRSGSAGANKS